MLLDQLKLDLTAAVKNRDHSRVLVLRFLLAEIHNQEIELHSRQQKLTEEVILAIIQKEVHRRQEAILAFQQGHRADLAARELAEQKILQTYLPPILTDQELLLLIKDVIAKINSHDFGLIMKTVISQVKGRAHGQKVAFLVKSLLD
jgi:uncharacterized protein YqeY